MLKVDTYTRISNQDVECKNGYLQIVFYKQIMYIVLHVFTNNFLKQNPYSTVFCV